MTLFSAMAILLVGSPDGAVTRVDEAGAEGYLIFDGGDGH